MYDQLFTSQVVNEMGYFAYAPLNNTVYDPSGVLDVISEADGIENPLTDLEKFLSPFYRHSSCDLGVETSSAPIISWTEALTDFYSFKKGRPTLYFTLMYSTDEPFVLQDGEMLSLIKENGGRYLLHPFNHHKIPLSPALMTLIQQIIEVFSSFDIYSEKPVVDYMGEVFLDNATDPEQREKAQLFLTLKESIYRQLISELYPWFYVSRGRASFGDVSRETSLSTDVSQLMFHVKHSLQDLSE